MTGNRAVCDLRQGRPPSLPAGLGTAHRKRRSHAEPIGLRAASERVALIYLRYGFRWMVRSSQRDEWDINHTCVMH